MNQLRESPDTPGRITIVSLLVGGFYEEAQRLSGRALLKVPSNIAVQLGYAFSLIPTDPCAVLRVLDGVVPSTTAQKAIRDIDVLCARIAAGAGIEELAAIRDECLSVDLPDEPGWFWRPSSLRGDAPAMYLQTIPAWYVDLEATLTG